MRVPVFFHQENSCLPLKDPSDPVVILKVIQRRAAPLLSMSPLVRQDPEINSRFYYSQDPYRTPLLFFGAMRQVLPKNTCLKAKCVSFHSASTLQSYVMPLASPSQFFPAPPQGLFCRHQSRHHLRPMRECSPQVV